MRLTDYFPQRETVLLYSERITVEDLHACRVRAGEWLERSPFHRLLWSRAESLAFIPEASYAGVIGFGVIPALDPDDVERPYARAIVLTLSAMFVEQAAMALAWLLLNLNYTYAPTCVDACAWRITAYHDCGMYYLLIEEP